MAPAATCTSRRPSVPGRSWPCYSWIRPALQPWLHPSSPLKSLESLMKMRQTALVAASGRENHGYTLRSGLSRPGWSIRMSREHRRVDLSGKQLHSIRVPALTASTTKTSPKIAQLDSSRRTPVGLILRTSAPTPARCERLWSVESTRSRGASRIRPRTRGLEAACGSRPVRTRGRLSAHTRPTRGVPPITARWPGPGNGARQTEPVADVSRLAISSRSHPVFSARLPSGSL